MFFLIPTIKKKVQEALTKGVDLRAYTLKVEEDLHNVETSSVYDYVAESDNFATLHAQIDTCDQILESMEKVSLLLIFLKSISLTSLLFLVSLFLYISKASWRLSIRFG